MTLWCRTLVYACSLIFWDLIECMEFRVHVSADSLASSDSRLRDTEASDEDMVRVTEEPFKKFIYSYWESSLAHVSLISVTVPGPYDVRTTQKWLDPAISSQRKFSLSVNYRKYKWLIGADASKGLYTRWHILNTHKPISLIRTWSRRQICWVVPPNLRHTSQWRMVAKCLLSLKRLVSCMYRWFSPRVSHTY